MITLKWFFRMVCDIVRMGITNRMLFMPVLLLVLIFSGVIIVAAKISAPFIYTLF